MTDDIFLFESKAHYYYWKVLYDSMVRHQDIIDLAKSRIPSSDEVVSRRDFRGSIVFTDGSRLNIRVLLALEEYEIVEKHYAYNYWNPEGVRYVEYDDAPHHPYLLYYPDHMHKGPEPRRREKDVAHDPDIKPPITFSKVLAWVHSTYFAS